MKLFLFLLADVSGRLEVSIVFSYCLAQLFELACVGIDVGFCLVDCRS